MSRGKKQTPKKEKRLTRTNPHGVNQYTMPDPRQALFLSYLFDPKSETFGKGKPSALKAGFGEAYAETLTLNAMNVPKWFSEYLEENPYLDMVDQAEKNLRDILNLPHIVPAMGAFGPVFQKVETKVKGKNGRMNKHVEKVPVMTVSTGILKIKENTSHFVLERLKRKEFGKEAPKIGKISFNFNQMKGDQKDYQ